MCGRYVVTNPVNKTKKIVKTSIKVENDVNYNAHPSQELPIIKKYSNGFGPMLKGFKQIEFNNEKKLISAINKKTAGIIIEPIQGEGGIRPANLSFLKLLRKICNEKKILLFFDEVQCGFGRSGKLFSHEWA